MKVSRSPPLPGSTFHQVWSKVGVQRKDIKQVLSPTFKTSNSLILGQLPLFGGPVGCDDEECLSRQPGTETQLSSHFETGSLPTLTCTDWAWGRPVRSHHNVQLISRCLRWVIPKLPCVGALQKQVGLFLLPPRQLAQGSLFNDYWTLYWWQN